MNSRLVLSNYRWLIRFTDISPTCAAAQGETPFHVAAALGQSDVIKVKSEHRSELTPLSS